MDRVGGVPDGMESIAYLNQFTPESVVLSSSSYSTLYAFSDSERMLTAS